MPEIPILTPTAQTQNPVQAINTGESRRMGEAVGQLGSALFDYGNLLARNASAMRAKQDQLEADRAEAELRKAYMLARQQERVRGDMSDPTGITSVGSIEETVAPIKERLLEGLSSDSARALFNSRAAKVDADAVPETLSMAVKANAERVVALREERVSSTAALAASNPTQLGEYLSEATLKVYEDAEAGLIPQSEVEEVARKDRQAIIISTAENLKQQGLYEEAKHVITANREDLGVEATEKLRNDVDKKWAESVNLQEDTLRLKKQILTEAREEKRNQFIARIIGKKEAAPNDPFKVEEINEEIVTAMQADPMTYPPEAMAPLLNRASSKEVLNDNRQEILWLDKNFRPGIRRDYVSARADLFARPMSDAKRSELFRMLQNMKDQESKDPMATKLIDAEMERIKADVAANWPLTGEGLNDPELKRVQLDRVKEFLLRVHKNGPTSVEGVRNAVTDFRSADMPTYSAPSGSIVRGDQQSSVEATRKQIEQLRAAMEEGQRKGAPRSILKPQFDELRRLEGVLLQLERNERLRGNK